MVKSHKYVNWLLPAAAVVLALLIGTSAYADPGPSTIEVVAPSPIAFETFAFDLNEGESATPGSVTITEGDDNPTGWEVAAKDLTNGGLMKNAVGEAALSAKLQISDDGTAYVDADPGITYSDTGLLGTLPFWANQTVTNNETPGEYSITITFTGSITF